jgi:hypothetical protein
MERLPREIVGDILAESGHKTTARLLGREWRDLRTRRQLEEELLRPIEPEDLLRYSNETGKDFVVYGKGLNYDIQDYMLSSTLNPDPFEDSHQYYSDFFILTGNSEKFIELYSYKEMQEFHRESEQEHTIKKTSPISEFRETFDYLYRPILAIYSKYVVEVAYQEEGDEEEERIVLADSELTIDDVTDNYFNGGQTPTKVWTDDCSLNVEGISRRGRYIYFYGRANSYEKMRLDPEVAEYILRRRVADQIPVENAVDRYRIRGYDVQVFRQLLALKDGDPRPEIKTSIRTYA